MLSTGNDIVALSAINVARTLSPGFYSKIIMASEKVLYDEHFSTILLFEHFVWLAWSVKESVYKFLQRSNPGLVFSPSKIILTQLVAPVPGLSFSQAGRGFDHIPAYRCTVKFDGQTLYSRSVLNDDLIFSVVNSDDDFSQTRWGIKQINSAEPADQSREVREFLRERLNGLFTGKDLIIGKNPYGCPILLHVDTELTLPVSFAHHDRYVGYSLQLP